MSNFTIMTKDVKSVDDLVEYISLEPCFLDKVGNDSFQIHGCDEVFIPCIHKVSLDGDSRIYPDGVGHVRFG